MVNKFLIAIAGIVVVMAVLVAMPRIGSNQDATELRIKYVRDHIAKMESGILDVTTSEVLRIENDGSATYSRTDSYPTMITTDERRFSLNSDEIKRLKALIFETGFMQIPVSKYDEREGLANYTRYQIVVHQGDDNDQKPITWFNQEASQVPVPSIITNIGSQLDAIIERHIRLTENI